jgi:hypothetical protein
VQTGAKPQAGLADVPLLVDLAASPDDKKVLEILAYPEEMGRPFFMPPGTPKPLVDAMRRAFDATMKDPAFLADAEKSRLEIDPVTGEEMEAMIKQAFATPKAQVQRALEMTK